MKKLLITLGLIVVLAMPVYACTPPLNTPTMPDISDALEAAKEAGRKAAENVIIPKEWYENIGKETETEKEATYEETIQDNNFGVSQKWEMPEHIKQLWHQFIRR